MKVLHISNDYFFSGLYPQLQKSLLDAGCDSFFFVPTSYNSKVTNQDERVFYTPCYHSANKLFFQNKQSKIYRHFKNVVYKTEPQLLHGHFLFSGGYSCLEAKKEFDIPYVIAVRNTDVNLFLKHFSWLRPLGLSIMKEASTVVFVGEAYRQQVINKYVPKCYRESILSKSIVISNGISPLWLQVTKQEKELRDKHICIVYTGIIDRNKNLTTTAKACELLISKGYNVTYTAIGKIIDKRIINCLRSYSFFNHIQPQTSEQLIDIYASQNIFVMPSIHETFGLVYAEAMSQGLPIIYTRGQGFDMQFQEGVAGFSVDPQNPEEIASKIELICNNYSAISLRCRELSKKFDWTRIANEYIGIYESVYTHKLLD